MKKNATICSLALLLNLFSNCLQAQVYYEESQARLFRDIGALAHDSMLGREVGTPSELIAATYIDNSFREAHLKPFNSSDGSFLHPFKFGPIKVRECLFSLDNVQYQRSVDYGVVPGSGNGSVHSMPIIEFQPGSDTKKIEDPAKYKDKVVMIDMMREGTCLSESFPNTIQFIHESISEGAVAIILHNANYPDFKNRIFDVDSMPYFSVPVVYLTEKPLKKINSSTNLSCSLKVNADRTRQTAYNVIGLIDNGSPQTVVIGGHFDHVGISGDPKLFAGEQSIHNGADDNASGTAAVMELARWANSNKSLQYNYLFIAFSAEEKGLLGSWNFCNDEEFNKLKVTYMLNLDMIGRLGWNGKNRLTVLGLASSALWKGLIKEVPHNEFKLLRIKGAPGFSDHYPFLKHRIPIIFFTTGLEKEYHTPLDDSELINYKGEAAIVEYLKKFIIEAEQIKSFGFRKVNIWQDAKAVVNEMILRR